MKDKIQNFSKQTYLKIKSAIKYKIALFLNYLFNEAKSFAMFAATLALL